MSHHLHLEPPKKHTRSIRDFAAHYAMIVVSILTALALEQVAHSLHHDFQARSTKIGIEREIRENQARVTKSAKEIDATLKTWRALAAKGVAQLKSNEGSKEERLELLREAAANYKDSLPTLRTNAWDAAIANHTLNYLDPDDLKRYAELYSVQKLSSGTMVNLALDGTIGNLSDIAVALATGNIDPLGSVRILDWRIRTLSMIQSNIRQIDAALATATAAR